MIESGGSITLARGGQSERWHNPAPNMYKNNTTKELPDLLDTHSSECVERKPLQRSACHAPYDGKLADVTRTAVTWQELSIFPHNKHVSVFDDGGIAEGHAHCERRGAHDVRAASTAR